MNPYDVLGIDSSASDEEVSSAYKKLAKKFHPDMNPGDKTAVLQMRAINAAYEEIKKQRAGGGTNGSSRGAFYSGASYSGYNSTHDSSRFQSDESTDSSELRGARQFLASGNFSDAYNVLSAMRNRNAKWHYYFAAANAGLGNKIAALDNAGIAVSMEPDNPVYRNYFNELRRQGTMYQNYGFDNGFNMRQGGGFSCLDVLCMSFCCSWCCNPCN